MTATDWIALLQAAFLLAAALFAWRGYSLAVREHREARDDARKAPLRALVADVIAEVKLLGEQAERTDPWNDGRAAEVAARQRRLAIALTFVPPNAFNLFTTQQLATSTPRDVTPALVEKTSSELLILFARIERGDFSILDAAPQAYRASE